MANVVIGVVGGSGGVGASTFAAGIAAAAAPSTLVDLDPVGGGVDVLLGIESAPGARWSGLRLDGGHLEPELLADGLPRWRSVAVLAADVAVPSPAAAGQVLDAAAVLGTVVLDLPRAPSPVRDAMLRRCTLAVVVAAADVRGVAAARAVVRSLPEVAAGAVVRRGVLGVDAAVGLLGVPLLGVLPATDRSARITARVAAGVLDGIAGVGARAA